MNQPDQEPLAQLIKDVDTLIADLDQAAQHQKAEIDRVAPTHYVGAKNLVHYTYLRTHDLRPLQARLAAFGSTRLSTSESSVMARVEAARNVLGALAGEGLRYPGGDVAQVLADADEILDEHAELLLGEPAPETPSCIMVTLPSEAAEDPDMVRGFAKSGMDLARINCAHDDEEAWARMIANVRAAANEMGREIRVSMDLAGPKVRTGPIAPGSEVGRARVKRTNTGRVITPARLWITPIPEEGNAPPRAPQNLPGRPVLAIQVDPEWFSKLSMGSVINTHDNRGSRRSFTVCRVEPGAVLAEGQRNAYLTNSSLLEHNYDRARVHGIPPTVQKVRLRIGDRIFLTSEDYVHDPSAAPGRAPRLACTLPQAVEAIKVGHRVLFDDGAIAAVCIERRERIGHTDVELEVTRARPGGVNLAAYKGINLPDSELPLPSLTEEDVRHLRFIAENADIAAVSFIRDVADVDNVLQELGQIAEGSDNPEQVRNLGLVLKIETIPAYKNLASILLAGMRHQNLGVMIARGDLAVELGFGRMAEVPPLIMAMAEAAHVPVILATQVLETMAKSGLPSRAEISDAALALRAECVMLNKGPHINDAIKVLTRMSRELGRSQRKSRILLRKIKSWEH